MAAIRGDGRLIFDFPESDPEAAREGIIVRTYLNLLKENLPAIIGDDIIFIQDNAPVYPARKIYEWLREMWYTVLLYPPYSPDLNPIEYLWFYLKELVYKIHPGAITNGGSAEARGAALKQAIIKVLETLPERKPYLIPALHKSFRERLQAVEKARGGKTKY